MRKGYYWVKGTTSHELPELRICDGKFARAGRLEHGLLVVRAGLTCADRHGRGDLDPLRATRCASPHRTHALLSSVVICAGTTKERNVLGLSGRTGGCHHH